MTVSVDTGKGGKKSVNAELNLVPFIDFLSVLISFLLVSAVWTQLARINVTQKSASGGAPSDTPLPNNPDQLKISVAVNDRGFILQTGPIDKQQIDKKGTEYNYEELFTRLSTIKEANPDKDDLIVGAKAGISYETVIRTVDYCVKAGFPSVTVAPADEIR
jgi:biopolymer transport protein TolR